ncbi:MAG: hypothetical protein HY908_05020 [Myxococcales bacterium]|nr:hypothetical protein [Myxococcales bacterium]
MSATYTISSCCECEAVLGANLDEKHQVVEAWAKTAFARESAPAHTVGGAGERFDLGWHCPFCGRHTLRSVHEGALRRLAEPAA